jgi:hypothetical protein
MLALATSHTVSGTPPRAAISRLPIMSPINSVLVLVLMVLSGFADSLGFYYAAKIWEKGAISWSDLGRSALGWGAGITMYVFALRYMMRAGVTSAEVQTAIWFAMTIIGVVIFSGRFFQWARLDQAVALLVMTGLGWLLVRTAE